MHVGLRSETSGIYCDSKLLSCAALNSCVFFHWYKNFTAIKAVSPKKQQEEKHAKGISPGDLISACNYPLIRQWAGSSVFIYNINSTDSFPGVCRP